MGARGIEEAQTEGPSQADGMISVGKFTKSEHIQKTAQFRNIYKSGRSLKHGQIVVYYLANSLAINRIGFSISSGRVKKASSRNRIRRLFKEAYRRNKDRFKTGFDFVFVVRKDPSDRLTYKVVESDLIKIMSRLGICI